ncbi:MAG: hypothetical protein OXG35_34160 [Acidobacteria bacterium]|nr:hypothetical protein [Acidobacteriota bacterium]
MRTVEQHKAIVEKMQTLATERALKMQQMTTEPEAATERIRVIDRKLKWYRENRPVPADMLTPEQVIPPMVERWLDDAVEPALAAITQRSHCSPTVTVAVRAGIERWLAANPAGGGREG